MAMNPWKPQIAHTLSDAVYCNQLERRNPRNLVDLPPRFFQRALQKLFNGVVTIVVKIETLVLGPGARWSWGTGATRDFIGGSGGNANTFNHVLDFLGWR
ncbi:MAG: hypothetical protein VB855_18195, partial [Pirellulaceae bacterium]